jgi:hypothetical protein
MKNIAGLFLLLIISCTTTLEPKSNDWAKEKLIGPVKKIIEIQYKPLSETKEIQGKENLGLRQKVIHTFNKMGFYEEITSLMQGQKITNKKKLKYNDNWQLISKKEYDGMDTLPISLDEYKYNETGKLVEQAYSEENIFTSKTVYEFNKEEGIKIGRVYNSKGNVSSVLIFQSNSQDNLIHESKLNRGSKSLTYKIYNKYNKAGELTATETYSPLGNNFSISKLDKEGNQIELLKYQEGLITSSCTYSYDDKGNQMDISCSIYEGKVKKAVRSTMKYEFDKEGNWIKKITYQEGIVAYLVERTYIYY